MVSDDKGKGIKETIADEAKGVAVEVYKDAAKPAVAAAGSTLGRLVRLALRPIELLTRGGERLMSAVERKLAGVPEDRLLLPPPATIAAPAALQYALLGEGDEVSEPRRRATGSSAWVVPRTSPRPIRPTSVGQRQCRL